MRTIQISEEDYEFLKDLQHELNTQENDGNADPVYWGVMEHRMEPAPEGCGDAIIYMGDDATMTTEEAVEYINENIRNYDEELQEQWKDVDKNCMDDVVYFIHDEMEISECRIVWQEEKEFISKETGAFITKRACKEYIEKCHYNHSKPHTYAMTAYRNYELERLLKILRGGLDFEPVTKSIWRDVTEEADLKRFVILWDGEQFMSPPCRWPFKDFEGFIQAMNKKFGAHYTKWTYMDEIVKL
jgi:hypothetical protein